MNYHLFAVCKRSLNLQELHHAQKFEGIDINCIGCMEMKFLQVDIVLNRNICCTFVVMTTNSDVIMTLSVIKLLILRIQYFRIISGYSWFSLPRCG